MKQHLIFIIILFSLIEWNCSQGNQYLKNYPFIGFKSVKLLSVKPEFYKLNGDSLLHLHILFYQDGVLAFIDSAGKPLTNQFTEKQLDKSSIVILQKLFRPAPQKDSFHLDKTCESVFRDAIVFYDESGAAIAYCNLCFNCELSDFNPYEARMADFDNSGRWDSLRYLFALNGIVVGHPPYLTPSR